MTPLRLSDLAGCRLGLWGLGEEGESVLRAIERRLPGQEIVVIEEADRPGPAAVRWQSAPGVRLAVGRDAVAALGELDVVVKSPGVSLYRPELAAARDRGTRFVSASSLWLAEIGLEATTVAVTGTKGKTTTSSLLGHLLSAAGMRAEVAGNIGRPLLDLLDSDGPPKVWVVELSSYQTADLVGRPSWAVLLNLFPEHLDWHGSTEIYYRDKLKLFRDLSPGHAVVNANDPETLAHAAAFEAPRWFGDEGGFHVREGWIRLADRELIEGADLALVGRHNLENACAALTVAQQLGAPLDACLAALPSFQPSRHRLQALGDIGGVLWVDDSISTVPQSAAAAVAAFPERPLTLLVGGFDRGLDYTPLVEAVLERPVEVVVTMPDNGGRIAREIEAERSRRGLHKRAPRVLEAADLDEAVELARKETPRRGVVLLSPAAASYGRFKDHRERGRRFARAAGFEEMGDRLA